MLEGLRRMTLIPAQILEASVPQMMRKGRVQVGADADLVVFDLATVSDRGTFTQPNQTATGMRYVIVNGTAVIRDGELVRDALPGRAIRRATCATPLRRSERGKDYPWIGPQPLVLNDNSTCDRAR